MNHRSISPMGFIALIFAFALLLYFKRESNEEKNNQHLLKEVIEKPISQIQRELNPKFVQMVENDSNDSR